MLWIKAFHIIFMVTWFAGLFYLPRLFVYHSMADDPVGIERFKVMERKLFYGIMTPGGLITVILGIWLLFITPELLSMGWMQAKLVLVLVLLAYHAWCWKLVKDFRHDSNRHSHVWYRWFNEFPVLLLIAIVVLVEVMPF